MEPACQAALRSLIGGDKPAELCLSLAIVPCGKNCLTRTLARPLASLQSVPLLVGSLLLVQSAESEAMALGHESQPLLSA